MNTYSDSINHLIEELAALPSIGAKSAQRLAFHILTGTRGKSGGSDYSSKEKCALLQKMFYFDGSGNLPDLFGSEA